MAQFVDLWKLILFGKKSGGGGGTVIRQAEPNDKVTSTVIVTVTSEVSE